MPKLDSAPQYFWLEPLRVLLEIAGPYNPKFKYWTKLIGGSQGQELHETEVFCNAFSGDAVEWTVENMIQYGPNELLKQWAEAEMHTRYCVPGGGGG